MRFRILPVIVFITLAVIGSGCGGGGSTTDNGGSPSVTDRPDGNGGGTGGGGDDGGNAGDNPETPPASTKPWTKQLGSTGDEVGYGIVTDADGNVYVVGSTSGSLDGNVNAGGDDLFVAKYDSAGEIVWTRQMGTAGDDVASGVALDVSGNIYVTGFTEGGLDGTINAGEEDIFVLKYDANGNIQWTRQLGEERCEKALGIAVDGDGSAYVTGYTTTGLDGNVNLGFSDYFIVKYNSSGVKQWTKQMGTTDYDSAYGIAIDGSGNLYVSGSTRGGLDGNVNAGDADIFIAKYDAAGNRSWTRQMGSINYDSHWDGDDIAQGIATDADGNVFITGYTGFDGDLDGNASAGGHDLFVAKYNPNGDKQWTRQLGSPDQDIAYGVATDTLGNVYVTGHAGTDFMYTILHQNDPVGGNEFFLIKYNSTGVRQWIKILGPIGNISYAVTTDASNNVYVTGYTLNGLDGNINAGGKDVFIVKYAADGTKL